MNTEAQYCHPSDCSIERVDATGSAGPSTKIYDSEGEVLFDFPGIWSDNEVMCALAFANQAYAKGVHVGKARKLKEFREWLGE